MQVRPAVYAVTQCAERSDGPTAHQTNLVNRRAGLDGAGLRHPGALSELRVIRPRNEQTSESCGRRTGASG
jgi:hypothetical protein